MKLVDVTAQTANVSDNFLAQLASESGADDSFANFFVTTEITCEFERRFTSWAIKLLVFFVSFAFFVFSVPRVYIDSAPSQKRQQIVINISVAALLLVCHTLWSFCWRNQFVCADWTSHRRQQSFAAIFQPLRKWIQVGLDVNQMKISFAVCFGLTLWNGCCRDKKC